jgi:hypothetical protein
MTQKSRKPKYMQKWEEKMVADYYDHRCRLLLDPLYEQLQQWKSGDIDHEVIFDSVLGFQKANRERSNFFSNNNEYLVSEIQQTPWFQEWVKTHPIPE